MHGLRLACVTCAATSATSKAPLPLLHSLTAATCNECLLPLSLPFLSTHLLCLCHFLALALALALTLFVSL